MKNYNYLKAAWLRMQSRCYNPNHHKYKNYGARGIRVCDRWLNSYEDFVNDIGQRPTPQHSLDRINVDGDYEPSNCRWATAREQANNRTNNRKLTLQGETMTVQQWCRKLGLKKSAVDTRLSRGWSIEKALTTPKTILARDKQGRFYVG